MSTHEGEGTDARRIDKTLTGQNCLLALALQCLRAPGTDWVGHEEKLIGSGIWQHAPFRWG